MLFTVKPKGFPASLAGRTQARDLGSTSQTHLLELETRAGNESWKV